MLLWALPLLLLLPPQRAAVWDDPTCTKGELSVARGAQVVMTCTISNAFRRVSISLKGRTLFKEVTPGCTRKEGWWLCVKGNRATLEIREAQDSQTGNYTWTIVGGQIERRVTTLKVSDTPGTPRQDPSPPQDLLSSEDPSPPQDLRSSEDTPQGRWHVPLILVPVLCLLVLVGVLFCRKLIRSEPVHTRLWAEGCEGKGLTRKQCSGLEEIGN